MTESSPVPSSIITHLRDLCFHILTNGHSVQRVYLVLEPKDPYEAVLVIIAGNSTAALRRLASLLSSQFSKELDKTLTSFVSPLPSVIPTSWVLLYENPAHPGTSLNSFSS